MNAQQNGGHGSSNQAHHQSQHANSELKNIFNLFTQNSDGEIEIKQINALIQQLDSLKLTQKPTSSTKASNQQTQQTENDQTDKKVGQGGNKAGASNNKQVEVPKQNNGAQKVADKDYIEVIELRYFPNNKTTLNFNEFCNYFGECMANKDIQEDLLQSCFNQFDFSEEAYIDSNKIKSIFEIFNDKTSQEEIQNVLKFCGVSNDKMSYDEFKQFFEKNL